jgi:oxygen-independent coproporphyrinogen III oxidase
MKLKDSSTESRSRQRNPELYLRTSKHTLHESEGITATEYCDALAGPGAKKSRTMALQIHLPFCATRCLNCTSQVTITHDPAEIDRYIDSLEQEVDLVADKIGASRRLTQLHVGGGSPNYLSDLQLVRIISIVEKSFCFDASTEMSIAANARHTSTAQLELLAGLGFTRISFSVSDLDPLVQFTIGRSQSLPMLRDVFAAARKAGFRTISTDLMYGLPSQSTQSMRQTVKEMTALAPDRISCKVFNRRTGSFPHQYAIGGGQMLPSVADKLALLNVIVEGLTGGDYGWVGLDYFVRQEDPLRRAQQEHKLKRNWLGYTLAQSSSILGFGTNSVSEVGHVCVQNHLDVPDWSKSLDTGMLPIRSGFRLSSAFKKSRGALTELMCNLESDDCASLLDSDQKEQQFDDYQNRGLLEVMGNRIAITTQGRFMLPQIWGESMPNQLCWSYPS